MEYFLSVFGLALITSDGNGYLPVTICYPTMIVNFFYTHIQCNSYKDNVCISGSQFVVIQTCKRSHSEMNSRLLTITVLLLQSVVFGQFDDDLLENGNDTNEIGLRIFGFEESVDDCSKIPRTRKEKIIGITYNLLCRHFGPHARNRVLRSVKMVKKNIPHRLMKRVFTTCLNRMKSKLMACFATVFDDYDLAGTEKPPHCLANLAIYPERKFQIFWLKKFPLILEYLDRVIKGYKMFNPSRVIVEKYLDQGIMKRWEHVSHFDYAKTKVEEWKSSDITNKKQRLKETIGEPSNLLDICVFSYKWLRNPQDFEDNICLRKILGNLLVLETFLQKEGVTLETEFIFGRYLLLHFLHIVKSVIRSRDVMRSRRAMNFMANPDSNTIAQLNDLKAMNVKCLDELRRTYDQRGGEKLSSVLKTQELQQCLNSLVDNTEAAGDAVKQTFLAQVHAPPNENLKMVEKNLIKSVMKSHKKMKPLQPIIQEMIDRGVPNPSPEYPWADKFLEKFKTSTIGNDHAKLGNAHMSTSYSSSTSCKSPAQKGKKNCWTNYVEQNMIVENELQKSGLSMQEMYLGDPTRMNMIYYIDEGLRKNKDNNGRVVAQYRRSLADSVDTDALLESLLGEALKDQPGLMGDDTENGQLARRTFGALPDSTITHSATPGFCIDTETEDYIDSSKPSTSTQIDPTEDYDQYEIKEFESITRKTYHCAARLPMMRNYSKPDNKVMELLDENGITSIRSKKHHYQVRNVRQKMCQAGFNVFQINNKAGSIHKRFKNTIRLMIYNTPGIFPGLKVIRSDLDRKRRREPQIWFRFELSVNPLSAEFDYDNYFVTVSGDFGRIQAYSKLLVALKMHKHLNNFNDSVSYKINLDLGIMEIVLANFGVALMKDKATTNLMVKALNGIRTELNNDSEVQVEFEESMKDAVDQVDPLLYSSIWLQSMAEKYEVVKMKEKSKTSGNPSQKSARGR